MNIPRSDEVRDWSSNEAEYHLLKLLLAPSCPIVRKQRIDFLLSITPSLLAEYREDEA